MRYNHNNYFDDMCNLNLAMAFLHSSSVGPQYLQRKFFEELPRRKLQSITFTYTEPLKMAWVLSQAVEKRANHWLSGIFHRHNGCRLTARRYFCVVVPQSRVTLNILKFKCAAIFIHDRSISLAMTSPTISGIPRAMHGLPSSH